MTLYVKKRDVSAQQQKTMKWSGCYARAHCNVGLQLDFEHWKELIGDRLMLCVWYWCIIVYCMIGHQSGENHENNKAIRDGRPRHQVGWDIVRRECACQISWWSVEKWRRYYILKFHGNTFRWPTTLTFDLKFWKYLSVTEYPYSMCMLSFMMIGWEMTWDITLWNFAKTRTKTRTNTQTNRHGHYNTSPSPYGGEVITKWWSESYFSLLLFWFYSV